MAESMLSGNTNISATNSTLLIGLMLNVKIWTKKNSISLHLETCGFEDDRANSQTKQSKKAQLVKYL
jgi:hypothetical protein